MTDEFVLREELAFGLKVGAAAFIVDLAVGLGIASEQFPTAARSATVVGSAFVVTTLAVRWLTRSR
ncbi:hypothetical protein [Natrinema sp. 74]|uniref:hypothetical protein n=1 Tax=Natrinema sp. 74 TaxID=3384159 RepID=UPI0038D45DBE